jgi:hypothetical protein
MPLAPFRQHCCTTYSIHPFTCFHYLQAGGYTHPSQLQLLDKHVSQSFTWQKPIEALLQNRKKINIIYISLSSRVNPKEILKRFIFCLQKKVQYALTCFMMH